MHNPDLTRRLNRLDQLINRTSVATENIELQGHWGRYLCIVAAGFLENALQTIYTDFATKSASPAVARYVTKRLQRVSNPNAAALYGSGWTVPF